MAHFYSISVYRVKDYTAAGIPLWSVKRGISSTTFQIRLFIILFIFANVLLGIHIKNLFYVLLMLLTGFYWLNVSLNLAKLDSVVWGKKTFLASLKVILVFSVVLSIARLL
jgi:protoheme IX farnesyltransferase